MPWPDDPDTRPAEPLGRVEWALVVASRLGLAALVVLIVVILVAGAKAGS